MTSPARFVSDLSHQYERLHTAKEDAFWTAYMGLADDADAAQRELDEREIELHRFLQDPARLRAAREQREAAADADAPEDVRTALDGWVRTFSAHVIEDEAARAMAERNIESDGAMARKRASLQLAYVDPDTDERVEASSVRLAVMVANEADERRRRRAWVALKEVEPFVLENGYLDLVRERNELGRALGAEDYYDWKVRRTEGMTKAEIFSLLDDLEERTRGSARLALQAVRDRHGPAAGEPWNLRYHFSGDVNARQDPYFPFSRALDRWGRSFAAMGIGYRGATMLLDLVDRKGKYENGFMHGPEPAWRDGGTFRRARIHFTANAIPGMVGAGRRATETLFHEGGHAAHFANIDRPAPCFAQEFAPTSVAFAETQSMFLDSVIEDADWQARYARTRDGEPMPAELLEEGVRETQRGAAWLLRASFAIPYCERAIYEIPDDELTPERVLNEVRAIERRLLFVEDASPRPALTVPHLLSEGSSAYYHGYILALMAVHQTRRFFLDRDGHLVDNPRIGPDLAEAYWRPGNEKRFPEFIEDLTGEPVSARALADHVNRTPDDAVVQAREAVGRLASIPPFEGSVDLDADLRVVHGHETVTDLSGGFIVAAERFAAWVEELE